MHPLTIPLLVAAAVGSGLMAGLFFSFSTFVLRALAKIPEPAGIAAMQSINVVIVRPSFLLVFFGTGVACVAVLIVGWNQLDRAAQVWTAIGGAAYLLGNLGVTVAFNIPLNNRLAAVDPESDEGARIWAIYLIRWLRWNHVRSIACLLATTALITAVFHSGGRA